MLLNQSFYKRRRIATRAMNEFHMDIGTKKTIFLGGFGEISISTLA